MIEYMYYLAMFEKAFYVLIALLFMIGIVYLELRYTSKPKSTKVDGTITDGGSVVEGQNPG